MVLKVMITEFLPEMSAKVSFLSEKSKEEQEQIPVLTAPLSAVEDLDGKKLFILLLMIKLFKKKLQQAVCLVTMLK
ncbi:MAG: hypothetical protein MZV64_68410 [Ignavibacteriales bacterium]|nr:hypothetical protein [Ignavibacteriales bacterium]